MLTIPQGPDLWWSIPLGFRIRAGQLPEIPELHHRYVAMTELYQDSRLTSQAGSAQWDGNVLSSLSPSLREPSFRV